MFEFRKYRSKMFAEANRTHINKMHAAMIILNGKPVALGHNSIVGKHASHAEFAALRTFMLDRGLIGWVRSHRSLWGSHKQYEKGS